MLVDVLKFAGRPLAVALVLILLAVKGFETLQKTPQLSSAGPAPTEAALARASPGSAFG